MIIEIFIKTKNTIKLCKNYVTVIITFVPLCSSSRAKGRIPRTMSIPLLSTKMAAHL